MRLAVFLFILSCAPAQAAPSDWPPPWANKAFFVERSIGARLPNTTAAPPNPVIGAVGSHTDAAGAANLRAGVAGSDVGYQPLRVQGANKSFGSVIGANPPINSAD